MRGADGGPWGRLCALPALWVGLLYDPDSQAEAWELVKDWKTSEMQYLRDSVPKYALKTQFRGRPLKDVAKRMVNIAENGLKRRCVESGKKSDESSYIEILHEIAESGVSPAERLLEKFKKEWNSDIVNVYRATTY